MSALTATAWLLLGGPSYGLGKSAGLSKRANVDESSISRERAAGTASSIVVGVLACLFLVALAGLGVFYFFKQYRQRGADVESPEPEKSRNWWMVDSKDEKMSISDWWRQSHSIPDRVEPPPSATVNARSSLQRLKSALTRKGAPFKSHARKESKDSSNDDYPLISKFMRKSTSPAGTIVLPMHTVPQSQPRYPSVLERGYRVPLYPVQPLSQNISLPRSLTTPAPLPPLPSLPAQLAQPVTVAERAVRKKLSPPPRALKILNGRPLVPISERKMGIPRSPAHRQRRGLLNQFKHPFLPLKDSDTAFPTISGPMPSAQTAFTNPKLGYAYSMTKPRSAPMTPGGLRQHSRASTRRIPVPVYETKPSRPLLPATPLHLREDVRVLPPGLSPSVRPTPTPI